MVNGGNSLDQDTGLAAQLRLSEKFTDRLPGCLAVIVKELLLPDIFIWHKSCPTVGGTPVTEAGSMIKRFLSLLALETVAILGLVASANAAIYI